MESEIGQQRSEISGAESKPDSNESERGRKRSEQPAVDEARPVVGGWVDLHMPQCGHKRMLAYEIVARMYECHESLIRRLLGRQVARLDADFYKRVMASEPALRAKLAARAHADLARYAGSAVQTTPLHVDEVSDAPR